MKKILSLVVVALLCLLILAGCSNGGYVDLENGIDKNGVVKWASVYLSAKPKQMQSAFEQINAAAATHQAKVIAQYADEDKNGINNASYTFNVPKDNFDAFVKELSNCGKLRNLVITKQDYSSQITDINNQIEVLTNQKAQYQALLDQSVEIEDKILLIEKISAIDSQLLNYKSQAQGMGAADYYQVALNIYKTDASDAVGVILGIVIFCGFWAGIIIMIVKFSKPKAAQKIV